MKIIGLCGSLRAKSINLALLKQLQTLMPAGDELMIATLHDIPMYNPDLETSAGFPSPVNELAKSIREADAILFSTPEYNYSIPGVLKNTLDWLSRLPNQPFAGKTAAILGASPGKLGTARAQYHLRQVGVFLDLHFLNKPEVMIGEAHLAFDEAGKLVNESTREHLRKMLLALKVMAENATKKSAG